MQFKKRFFPVNFGPGFVIPCALALGVLGQSVMGAGTPDEPFTYHAGDVLGTSLDLHVAALTKGDADKAHEAVMGEIERLRKILSTYDAGSDLGKVNASKEPVKVAPEVIAVLKEYEKWEIQSAGAFSGKVGGMAGLWKQAEAKGAMPEKGAVAAEVAKAKSALWKLDELAGTVQRVGDMPINVDSLGKGFIVSKAIAAGKIAGPGVRGLLLNIGGDISAVGSASRTAAATWSVDIADPAHPEENARPLASVRLPGMSIATSASYERGYQIAGKKLSHIIDPRTGYPVDSVDGPAGKRDVQVVSASVIAWDNGTANALAASLMVLPPEEGLALVARTSGAEALLVMSDGKQVRSPGFANYISVSSAVAGQPWQDGAKVTFTIEQLAGPRERPFMAIWIEDDKGKHVVTLAEWGSKQKYIDSLSGWNHAINYDYNLISMVTRATRPAGKYSFSWDGKDQAGKPVPAGAYKVNVEFAYEHSGHSTASAIIACGDQEAQAMLAHTRHFSDVVVTFAPKGK